MADLTDAQRKRAEARERRRKQSDSDDESTPSDGDAEQSHQGGVRQAAKVAAVAGAAGAAAAAARALTSHNEPDEEAEEPRDEAADEQPQHEEPQEDEQQQEEQQQPEDQQQQPQPEQEEEEEEPVAGANPSDARRVIDRGREQLQELLERPVESVSSLERTHNGWVLALEVVQLNRVPESTDVLASYEMELDENLDLRRYQQVRRYHRGRADRGEDS